MRTERKRMWVPLAKKELATVLGYDDHEQVMAASYKDRYRDTKAYLYVAIHNTILGPALGGLRLHNYPSWNGAMQDVLRLSSAMTYKAAMVGLPFGGGKAVLWGDMKFIQEHRKEVFLWVGEAIQILNGQYYTAEDAGTFPSDLEVVARRTEFVKGLTPHIGRREDNITSHMTALGVLRGIQASSDFYNRRFLNHKRFFTFVIQGALGKVGSEVFKHLYNDSGNTILVSDTQGKDKLKDFCQQSHMKECPVLLPETAHQALCDVFVPCALGGIINEQTVKEFQCIAIAGSANNQLETPELVTVLRERGILYIPDYVINAGGLIYVALIQKNGNNIDYVRLEVGRIYTRVLDILEEAQAENMSPLAVADMRARQIIKQAKAGR